MDFNLIISFAALLVSLIFLWWAGDLSVNYSIRMADVFNLNTLFIGFALISISTGFPELSVAISSSFSGVSQMSAGDILGSNVCDISLVLGLAILLYGTLKIKKKEAKDALTLLFIIMSSMLFVFSIGSLNWVSGIILIITYFVSIFWLWLSSSKKEVLKEKWIQEEIEVKNLQLEIKDEKRKIKKLRRISRREKILVITKLLGSILLVLGASEMAVHFAMDIANKFSLPLHTIGATVIAIGTSLPEISLSLNAMKKKQYSMALGNSLGSVLEQGTLLIGILAVLSRSAINTAILRSLFPYMFLSFFILGFSIFKRKKIGRIEASLMLLSFVVFLLHQILWIR